jgi:hypothetical protein
MKIGLYLRYNAKRSNAVQRFEYVPCHPWESSASLPIQHVILSAVTGSKIKPLDWWSLTWLPISFNSRQSEKRSVY